MFKKKKIQSKKNNNNIINIFGLIVIFLVFVLGIISLSFAKQFDFFNKIEVKKNSEVIVDEKKDDNKINILLLGRGGVMNDAPNLTDSIILASINKDTKIISMFSIPRDLYVEYYNGKKGKINKIYAVARAKSGSVEAGIDALKYNIELLTGEKVDYYVNIDFNGFIKFIDAIGGVKIDVPKTLIDTKFPDYNWGYRTFIVKKGTWLFDGNTALNYARSRHSTSDFDRGMRQQQIIEAVKNKLMEGGFFSKLNKAKKFYDVFKKYVYTDIGLSHAISIFNEINDSGYKIISSNLNDSCFEGDPFCSKGGFLYTPEREMYGGESVLLVDGSAKGDINNYKSIQKYLDLVFNNGVVYKENIDISVLNSTKVSLLAGNLSFDLRRYGLNIPFSKYSISTIKNKIFEKSVINYKPEVSESETIKFLKNTLPSFEFKEVTDLDYTGDVNSKIEIIIGNNYKDIISDLKKNIE